MRHPTPLTAPRRRGQVRDRADVRATPAFPASCGAAQLSSQPVRFPATVRGHFGLVRCTLPCRVQTQEATAMMPKRKEDAQPGIASASVGPGFTVACIPLADKLQRLILHRSQ